MSKRKAVDLCEEDDGDVLWTSELVDPNYDNNQVNTEMDDANNDREKIEMHLANIETFAQALRGVAGRNSENTETLLGAIMKEANDLCKTNACHKSLRALFEDVVDLYDDFSDDEEPSIESITNPKEKQWMIMFQQLREYRINNGDCKVPQGYKHNKKLAVWVMNQRARYTNLQKRKSGSKLTPDQITKLESIGMFWGKNHPPPVSWNERFHELSKFRSVRGNCNVPYNKTSPTQLAMWVLAQRMEYKRFKKGLDSLLTLDQIEKLNGIGMKWKVPKA